MYTRLGSRSRVPRGIALAVPITPSNLGSPPLIPSTTESLPHPCPASTQPVCAALYTLFGYMGHPRSGSMWQRLLVPPYTSRPWLGVDLIPSTLDLKGSLPSSPAHVARFRPLLLLLFLPRASSCAYIRASRPDKLLSLRLFFWEDYSIRLSPVTFWLFHLNDNSFWSQLCSCIVSRPLQSSHKRETAPRPLSKDQTEISVSVDKEKGGTAILTGHTKTCLHDHAVARSSASSPNPGANRSVSRKLGSR
jgi:hypothetical protein